ncbi:hypothetical protein MAH1_36750 [Sessilibacter sp. MAH1]
MVEIEECKKLVLEVVKDRFELGEIKATSWGYIVGWSESILGSGPALVDGETGYIFITSSKLKKQDEIREFGIVMETLKGKSIQEKKDAWVEHYKTFEIIPFF